MKTFDYTITDALGIHARPAGRLAKAASAFPDTAINVVKADRTAGADQLIRLMSLGVRQGDTVTITAEGPEESAAIAAMETFFRENL